MKKTVILFIAVLLASTQLYGITADDIIRRMEAASDMSMVASGKMGITDSFGERVKKYTLHQSKDGKMLLEFTNPEDAGQKILRIDNEIYLYFPDAVEIVRIQGDALKDRVLGSDFSYEDLTREADETSTLDKYKAVLDEKEETVDGFACYKVILTATKKDVVYPKEILWIDKDLFAIRKAHLFSLTDKLLRTLHVRDIKKVNGKNVSTKMEMADAMKKDSKTTFTIDKYEIDTPIDPNIFSLEELTW
ncbi:MAG: outer membrane lipoprotein-sorting protein [Spirochaetales bacterium]|nr:outer membrane lipoprotein-sorting protein [Spirochaetales bacterium]